MIPHSLTFLFIFGHFGRKQNPTGLQEVIQRLDKNSKTILIIKSTLERSFLMKKFQKNAFLKISVFTELNLHTCINNNKIDNKSKRFIFHIAVNIGLDIFHFLYMIHLTLLLLSIDWSLLSAACCQGESFPSLFSPSSFH